MASLYVTQQGASVIRESGRLVVVRGDDELMSAPLARIDQVVLVGGANITTPALTALLDRGIGLVFLTAAGGLRGRLDSAEAKNIALRRAQFRRADDPAFCLAVSRAMVSGKLRNTRTRLLRLNQRARDPVVTGVAAALHVAIGQLDGAADREQLMGIEGAAARRSFTAWGRLLGPPWVFTRRTRRPPTDPPNVLLSVLATLLHESCQAAIVAAGLDPGCGVFHADRYGRASLATDLMEEFRPIISEAVALTILNKQLLEPGEFPPDPSGDGLILSRRGWEVVGTQYEHRLRTLVTPVGLGRRLCYRRVLELQARRFRAVVDGSAEEYVPFLVR